MNCPLCDTPVAPGDDISPTRVNGLPTHRECLLRSTIGGIGHLTNHAHWCVDQHDPDATLSFRESALMVDAWVAEFGVEAAIAIPS